MLKRYHWRIRFAGAALALAVGLLCLLAALPFVVVGVLVLGGLVVGVVQERAELWLVVRIVVRWRAVCRPLGLCGQGEKGPVAPRLSRLWLAEDVLHLEYRPFTESRSLVGQADELARRLGFVSGRVHEEKPGRLFGGGRVVVELRRTRALASREVKLMLNVPQLAGMPELSRPGVGPAVAKPPGVPCPYVGQAGGPEEWLGSHTVASIQEDGRDLTEVLVESPGFEHLPDSCRPHFLYSVDSETGEGSWSDANVLSDPGRFAPCARWRQAPPTLTEVVGFSQRAPATLAQPLTADEFNQARDAHSAAIERYRDSNGIALWTDKHHAAARSAVGGEPDNSFGEGSHYWCVKHYREGRCGQPDPSLLRGSIAPLGGKTWREALGAVPVGAKAGGKPWRLSLIDNHVLVAGMMGSGKGSVIWSLIVGLAPAVAAGAVEIWGLDPKRVELAMGRGIFNRYAADPDDMVKLLEDAVAGLHARSSAMAGRVRRFEPSPETPLVLVICDELGYLMALMPQDRDNKHRQRAEIALSTLLALGRACGFVVVGALQDPRKEVIDNRDLFPTRVGMRLSHRMIDLVLGSKAFEQGARCDLISPDAPGTAYVVDEERDMAPVEVRASWVSDDAIRRTEAAVLAWRRGVSVAAPAAQPRQAGASMDGFDVPAIAPASAREVLT